MLSMMILSLWACSTTSGSNGDEAPAPQGDVPALEGGKAALKPGASPRAPLAEPFDFVEVQTERSFVHDRGYETRLQGVFVNGEEVAADAVLAAIVAHWGGFTPSGSRAPKDVESTVSSFLEAWDQLLAVDRQTGDAPSRHLAPLLERHPEVGPYHPPKVEIIEVDGEQVVVARQFEHLYVGRRGNVFAHRVRAFKVVDGTMVSSPGLETVMLRQDR